MALPMNSKRRISATSLNSPPRRPRPAWDTKLDALEHCYEGEVAEDRRKYLCTEAAERFLAAERNEAEKSKRIREAQDKIGASRDAVAANLRLLSQAFAKLTGTPRDFSAQHGKEKLSLEDFLPMFDKLGGLLSETSEPNASTLLQMDKLRKERDDAVEKTEVAQQDRSLQVEQVQAIQQQRDALLQEKKNHHDEIALLKRERDDIQLEGQLYHDRWLQEQAARKSTANATVPKDVLMQIEKEKDVMQRSRDRYRQERNSIRTERDALCNEQNLCQNQMKKMEKELAKASLELSTSKAEIDALIGQRTRDQEERNETRGQRDSMVMQRDQYQTRFESSEEQLKDIKAQLTWSRNQERVSFEQNIHLLQERDEARGERDSFCREKDQYHSQVTEIDRELTNAKMQLESSENKIKTYSSLQKKLLEEKRLTTKKTEQLQMDMETLERTFDLERRDFASHVDGLQSAHYVALEDRRLELERLSATHHVTIEELEHSRAEKEELGVAHHVTVEELKQSRAEVESLSATHQITVKELEQSRVDNEDLGAAHQVTIEELKQSRAESQRNLKEQLSAKNTDTAAVRATYASVIEDLYRNKNDEKSRIIAENNRLTDIVRRFESQQADEALIKERDHLRRVNMDLARDRASLRPSAEQTQAELQCLTARLESRHCSTERTPPKRRHDQTLSEEDEILDRNEPGRNDQRRRSTPGPSTGATTTGTGPFLTGGLVEDDPGLQGHGTGQHTAIQPGAKWAIERVLDKHFAAPPVPQTILTRLRGQLRSWDKIKPSWRSGGDVRKCVNSACQRKKTIWKDGDSSQACENCSEARRLCAVASIGMIELLPLRRGQNTLSMGDEAYWLSQE